MRKVVILLSSFAISACVTGYNPTYRFNQLQVVNLTDSTVENVSVSVVDSEKKLNCDKLMPDAICDLRFGKRRLPQQGINLSWTHPGIGNRSEFLNPEIPATFYPAYALRIVMEVNPDGSVKSFYEQDSSSIR